MFNQFREVATTRSGRALHPTTKVKVHLADAIAKDLKKLSTLLSEKEYKIRGLIDNNFSCARVNRAYGEWRTILQDFEDTEQEYRDYLTGDDLSVHDRLLENKRFVCCAFKDFVAKFMARTTERYHPTQDLFTAETQRLEEELKSITTRLEQVQVPKAASISQFDDEHSFEPSTVSEASYSPSLHPPLRAGQLTAAQATSSPAPRYRHPLDVEVPEKVYGNGGDLPRGPPLSSISNHGDQTLATLQKLADLMDGKRERLPQLEPELFSGDILQYPLWIRSFEMLIEKNTQSVSERLFYLGKYTEGEAKESINGFLCLFSEDAYVRARAVLQARYGDKVQVAQAYRQRLRAWKTIKKGDGPALRKLADFLWQCSAAMDSVRNLQSLGSAEEMCKILQILPSQIMDRWDRIVDKHYYARVADPRYSLVTEEGEYPPFVELCKFLSQEARILNGPSRRLRGEGESTASSGPGKKVQAFATAGTEREKGVGCAGKRSSGKRPPSCYFCQQPHIISKCEDFLKKTGEEKKLFASGEKLCFGCFSKQHGYAECKFKKPWLLKDGLTVPPEKAKVFQTEVNATDEEAYYTMIVQVEVTSSSQPGLSCRTYALLDAQADGCFMADSVVDELKLRRDPVQLELVTMGTTQVVDSNVVGDIRIRGVGEEESVNVRKLYTRQEIPASHQSIPCATDLRKWPHLSHMIESLPQIDGELSIGLLIGHNCPGVFVPRDLAYADDDKPYGVKTSLGWGIMGRRAGSTSGGVTCFRTSVKEMHLSDVCQAFDLEFHGDTAPDDKVSQNDILFQKIAESSLRKRSDGHFEMDLPLADPDLMMPDNRDVALRQLLGQKRRFKRDPAYLARYHGFMTDMLEAGHAERVENAGEQGKVSYTPHHGVEHPRKPNKTRVVSNFSSQKDGVSLNQNLLAGPDLTNNLVGVLCRFREERVAFMCDVKGMFHQVGVSPHHRDYLRFLWFEDGDPDKQILDYRMCVHPFGATSSPSAVNFAFKENARQLEGKYGVDVSSFIRRDFYVDDGLRSRATARAVVKLFLDAHKLCLEGGFLLTKFTCNSPEAIAMVPDELLAPSVRDHEIGDQNLPTETSLGLRWDMVADAFWFMVRKVAQQLTRRGMLSSLCSIYDPMGLISPIVLVGRIILQQLCSEGASWDETIPESYHSRWQEWYDSLEQLQSLRIPRCFKETVQHVANVQIHHFCDASTLGYGVCSYVRLEDEAGRVDVRLAMSKARVAPKKVTTMPRMELQAAVLAAKMAYFLKQELPYTDAEHYHWSDSRVVLGYIRNSTRRFHLYVTNRVAYIREHSQVSAWHYVRTSENPADMASRGVDVAELMTSDLWWRGPAFLSTTEWQSFDEKDECEVSDRDPELKKDTVVVNNIRVSRVQQILDGFERFSKWYRAVTAVLVWQKYFQQLKIAACRRRQDEPPQPIQSNMASRHNAEMKLISCLQQCEFADEFNVLDSANAPVEDRPEQHRRKNALKKKSSLAFLDPFLDEFHMIRLGGRLRNASMPHSLIHPLILPATHHLVKLIIIHQHELAQHPGRQATLAQVRGAGYWVLKGRTAVERYTRDCVICRRIRGTPIVQQMADLPEERLMEVPPFTYCGMDLFGPFQIKQKRSLVKRWICVFICFNSLAVHLEVVEELSTDSFLNAFRRLVGRRGPVRTLFSDRGTNFVGAANALKSSLAELDEQKIHAEMLKMRCDIVEFQFNSPKASHMGGLWERAIRTLRSVLSAILAQHSQRLNEESFQTFVVETESISNSKPLTSLDLSDPTAEAPLTPARLLTMKANTALPPPGKFQDVEMYGYKRWRQVQALAQLFWRQWRSELLPTLQARRKWLTKQPSLKIGDVVLLMDDTVPRGSWPLATITGLIPSHDQLVRRVEIRCHGSKYERPVCKLVYLGSVDQ